MSDQLRGAIVVGATGRTGSACVAELLKSGRFDSVVAVGHSRAPSFADPRVKAVQCPLADILQEPSVQGFAGVLALFICVGTQKKKAGVEAQVKLEHPDSLALAHEARARGVPICAIVTSRGSNASSSITYLRTKGRIEADLIREAFPTLIIARPGLIIGGDRGPAPGSFVVSLLRMCCMAMADYESIGRAMVRTAVQQASQPSGGAASATVVELENAHILQLGAP